MSGKKEYFSLNMRLDEETLKIIENLEKLTGFSKREIIAYSSQPCGPCGNDPVRVKGKDGLIQSIPRGILFTSMLQKHGDYKRRKQ